MRGRGRLSGGEIFNCEEKGRKPVLYTICRVELQLRACCGLCSVRYDTVSYLLAPVKRTVLHVVWCIAVEVILFADATLRCCIDGSVAFNCRGHGRILKLY